MYLEAAPGSLHHETPVKPEYTSSVPFTLGQFVLPHRTKVDPEAFDRSFFMLESKKISNENGNFILQCLNYTAIFRHVIL